MFISESRKTGRTVNRADLASTFGVGLPTVDAWVRRGAPFVERGRKGREWQFDTAAVIDWRLTNAIADALGGYQGESGNITKDEADRRRAVANAIMAEVEADEALDTVVRRADAEADMAAFCMVLKSSLSNAASKVAARAASIASAVEIEELARSEMNRAFQAAQGELAARWSGERDDGETDRED